LAEEPSGTTPLARDGETVVDPTARFRLELEGTVGDARLVLLDAADAMVPANGGREVARTTTLTLAPAAPLTPGARYRLRLEGAATRELHDAAGRTYAPVALAVLAAGAPPPPEVKTKSKRKRGR
jgi:hypothetical protein